ncbi:hypothetical protein ACFL0H_15455, partial [Thermodesulfobacteriota bacterium]
MEKTTEFLISQAKNLVYPKGKIFDSLWEEQSYQFQLLSSSYWVFMAIILGFGWLPYKNVLQYLLDNPKRITKGKNQEMYKFMQYIKYRYDILIKDEHYQIMIFTLLISPKYKPPEGYFEKLDHLQALRLYYTDLAKKMPLEITLRIDYAALRLACAVTAIMNSIISKSDRQYERLRGQSNIQIKTDLKKQIVIELFYKISTKDKSLNKIANDIKCEIAVTAHAKRNAA